jgi:hypothetical protein
MKLDNAASINVDTQTEGAPLLVSEGEGTQSVINLNLVSSSLKVLKLIRHPDGRFKKCKARFVARRFCPHDKLLFGLYDHQSLESTFVSPDKSSTWPWIQHDKLCLRAEMSGFSTGSPIPSDIAGFIGAHLQKKHEHVLMNHSDPFDCSLAKLLRAQGLQQSLHDPRLFFSDKVVVVLFDTGTLFWAPVANDIHDLLVRLQEEGMILHIEDIYSNLIPTKPIPQVHDTDDLSPEEGASSHASILGTCVLVTSPSSTAKQSRFSVSLFRSGLSKAATIFQYLRKKSIWCYSS